MGGNGRKTFGHEIRRRAGDHVSGHLAAISRAGWLDSAELMGDFLHPTEKGYAIRAAALKIAMAEK
jgi:hypothetical protein